MKAHLEIGEIRPINDAGRAKCLLTLKEHMVLVEDAFELGFIQHLSPGDIVLADVVIHGVIDRVVRDDR